MVMTMTIDARPWGRALGLALVLAMTTPPAATAADAATAPADAATEEVSFSQAETLLWMTDQLRAVPRAMVLRYSFTKSGTLEQGFQDEVKFDIHRINADGTKAAALQFFSGERNFPVPPVDSTTVNPVLKVYLQGDVYEMNRLTDPDGEARERWRYFQRRIKLALAESATVEPTTFEFEGRTWQGQRITLAPYVNDPRRNLFERFADKRYEFVVADDLPGYVYRIETVVPGSAEGAEPLVREVLQLTAVEPHGG